AIELVREAGIERVFANTHYLPHKIEPHLQSLGVTTVREETKILDTGGGLRAAMPYLGPGPVITLNPDAAWTGPNPIKGLLSAWTEDMRALLLLVPLSDARTTREDGDFSLEHGQIRRKGEYLYTGAQIIRTSDLHRIPENAFSLNRYWDLLAADGPIHGIIHRGGWCDIGTPAGLADAEAMLKDV
ncbi:MAG: NTP transferase domain-containing protein, partial [Silicimonas sp.]|nr:NTP transferase domain-containing protein [Silicimonas sp.]